MALTLSPIVGTMRQSVTLTLSPVVGTNEAKCDTHTHSRAYGDTVRLASRPAITVLVDWA